VRPVLHEAEKETEAKTYEVEATKFGEPRGHVGVEDLTSLVVTGGG